VGQTANQPIVILIVKGWHSEPMNNFVCSPSSVVDNSGIYKNPLPTENQLFSYCTSNLAILASAEFSKLKTLNFQPTADLI
jgi:hypothetical protein